MPTLAKIQLQTPAPQPSARAVMAGALLDMHLATQRLSEVCLAMARQVDSENEARADSGVYSYAPVSK